MQRYNVEDMDSWVRWKKLLRRCDFVLWQTQFWYDLPSGYIVGFMNTDTDERLEIITHNKEVAKDVIHNGL